MRRIQQVVIVILLLLSVAQIHGAPKREFRGVWLHTVFQSRYQQMNDQQTREYLIESLDKLQRSGINAVIFQVRPTADAFYCSELEPWSRFFKKEQGKAPWPLWDPLAFIIEQCHVRNIELHAWLNPYRVTVSEDEKLHPNHIYNKHPEWFVSYGKKLYFDPGLPQCREFINRVVGDIVTRYDVDAIHMDDYFYPYPIAGVDFPDQASFDRYAAAQGFAPTQRGDWRRNNVNTLIQGLQKVIKDIKPWVRFGVSPFGIYLNEKNDPKGSKTNGLTNYLDLYADTQLWVEKGWVDYNVPQLYWEIGTKAADYAELIGWWPKHNYGKHLYIGQSISRSMPIRMAGDTQGSYQITTKMSMMRSQPQAHGNCFWHGYELLDNYYGIADTLRTNWHRYPALIPAYTDIDHVAPAPLRSLKAKWNESGYHLHWQAKSTKDVMNTANYYVVYRVAKGQSIDFNDPSYIVALTKAHTLKLPYGKGDRPYVYYVSVVDRCHNESKPKAIKLNL